MKQGAELVNPYDAARPKTQQVEEMFDSIAPAYDFMNRAMSFGLHRRWLAKALKLASAGNPRDILDVATGTADVAIALAGRLSEAKITGIDLSEGMLEVGRRKVAKTGLQQRVELRQADCLALPFADNSFDVVTVAYGVRNFEHLADGYREMARVLRPGGRIVVIELSVPTNPVVKPFYKLYTKVAIPMLGRIVSRDRRAYSYLPESIEAVAQGTDMTAMMERSGFTAATHRPLTLGVCTLYTATKL